MNCQKGFCEIFSIVFSGSFEYILENFLGALASNCNVQINFFQEDKESDPLSNMKTISVVCLWDNPDLYSEEIPPMYIVWKQNSIVPVPKSLLADQSLLSRS